MADIIIWIILIVGGYKLVKWLYWPPTKKGGRKMTPTNFKTNDGKRVYLMDNAPLDQVDETGRLVKLDDIDWNSADGTSLATPILDDRR